MSGGTYGYMTRDLGQVDLVTPADPAAGADVTQTIPANEIWKVAVVCGVFTCGVAVANRQLFCQLETGGGAIIWRTVSINNQTAGITYTFTFGITLTATQNGTAPNISTNVVLPDTRCLQSTVLRVSAVNIQAADDFSAVTITRARWIA